MTLGQIIREWRMAQGLSQAALARRMDIEGQTISNIESGHTRILRAAPLHRFSDISGIPVTRLVSAARMSEAADVGHGNPAPPKRKPSPAEILAALRDAVAEGSLTLGRVKEEVASMSGPARKKADAKRRRK